MQLNPYLTFSGQCEAAFKFYEKVLGGKIEAMHPHAGSPMEDHVPPEWRSLAEARLALGSVGELVWTASDLGSVGLRRGSGLPRSSGSNGNAPSKASP